MPQSPTVQQNEKSPPSALLIDNYSIFESLPDGAVLDLACGAGRNGLYLAKRFSQSDACENGRTQTISRRVTLADIQSDKLKQIQREIDDESFNADTWCANFETPDQKPLADKTFAAILVFRYLHRPLIDAIKQAVIPGGVVFYETFTIDQPAYGRPTNPDYLLKHGELKSWFQDWDIIHYSEGIFGSSDHKAMNHKAMAQIICRKPIET